jgi:hypothetical protein
MGFRYEEAQVAMAPGGVYPQMFRLAGRPYRILAIHSIETYGFERRYRVASSEGFFELAQHTVHGGWHVRRRPNWLSRILYRWQTGARYPLPAWRRRSRFAPSLRVVRARSLLPAPNAGPPSGCWEHPESVTVRSPRTASSLAVIG